jgi:hypothetical protein
VSDHRRVSLVSLPGWNFKSEASSIILKFKFKARTACGERKRSVVVATLPRNKSASSRKLEKMTATAHHPAAAAYEAQLRIRREGEERNNAQQDLNSWLSELKLGKNEPPCVKAVAKKTKAPSPAEAMLVVTNEPISVEDERLRGNKFFSQGKYQDAVNCYTRCLGDKEAMTSPVVYSNRGKPQDCSNFYHTAERDSSY